MKQFKLDDSILLALLLKGTKKSKKQYSSAVFKQFNLARATWVSTVRVTHLKKIPGTSEFMYTDYDIWDTGKHLVKATKYGRIVDIEVKAKSVVSTPQPRVIIKRKKTINKP
jgi:hypothetical protein